MKMFHNLISTEVPRPAGCHLKLQILDFSDLLTFPMQQLHSHHPPENFPKCILQNKYCDLKLGSFYDYPPHQQRIVQEFDKMLISPLHTASKFQSSYWKRGRKTYMTRATYLLTFSWFHPPELISPWATRENTLSGNCLDMSFSNLSAHALLFCYEIWSFEPI